LCRSVPHVSAVLSREMDEPALRFIGSLGDFAFFLIRP
jgi:hypothetical protein